MCFASSSENTGLFPQPAEPPRHVLRPAQPQTPNGKRALETPAATAMHLRQTPLHGDCFTLRNLRRAVGAVFISPAFQRGVSADQLPMKSNGRSFAGACHPEERSDEGSAVAFQEFIRSRARE
jgi:hypothetical protein